MLTALHIVTELLAGGTLHDALRAADTNVGGLSGHGRLLPPRVLALGIASGLAALHGHTPHPVMHGDISSTK
jgi:hypothetical protein